MSQVLFGASLDSIDSQVVETLRTELDYTRFGHDVEAELFVHYARARLAQIALVGHQTRAAKTTRTAYFVQPFGPFWIQHSIRFFVLWFEHCNSALFNQKQVHSMILTNFYSKAELKNTEIQNESLRLMCFYKNKSRSIPHKCVEAKHCDRWRIRPS